MSTRYQEIYGDAYKVGSDYNQDYDKIRQTHKPLSKKFEDWEFPPGEDAIGEIDLRKMGIRPVITWRRPHEIVQLTSSDPNAKPIFIDPKTVSRFQIKQGKLGDCWYLAGMSTLTTQKSVFKVVVPEENISGFDDGEYCGAFYFRFWRAGVWTDIIIDDRLPCVTFPNGKTELLFSPAYNNQFWTALAEKAFAKMYRSYETIEGGYPEEALEDFSGGIAEMILLNEVPENFESALLSAYEKKSFIGISSVNEPEEGEELVEGKLLGDGFVSGHAYSVTRIENLTDKNGQRHLLLRLRNPWGYSEWEGKWSDKDDESWATMPKDLRNTKKEDGIIDDGNSDDGEFWISYEDAIKRCDVAHFCHWAPETLDRFYEGPPLSKTWDIKCFDGQWSNELRGNGENIGDLKKYPAHVFTVESSKGTAGKVPIVVALMYKDYGKSGPDEGNPLFGYRIFKIPDGDRRTSFDTAFFEKNTEITTYENSSFLREMNRRFEVEPGNYCVVPYLEIDGDEIPEGTPVVYLKYLLRIFSERINK